MDARPPAEDERLDALRRRLYRADATPADRQRYAAARAAVRAPEPADAPTAPATAPPARRPRGAATVLAVVLAGAAGIVVGEHLAQPATGTARPTAALQQDFEARFAVNTSHVSAPRWVATSVHGVPVLGQEFAGHGPAVVPVDLQTGAFAGGRAMVVLTAAKPAPTTWRALRVPPGDAPSTDPVVLAQGTADPGQTVATPSTFVYPDAAPTRVAVEAPDDIRWTLVVAATAQIGGRLH